MTSPTIADPELDPTATYAVDPARVRVLARQVVAAPEAERFRRTSPMTGGPIADLPLSTSEDVTTAIAAARAAQGAWAALDPAERKAIFLRFHDLVLDRQVELLDLIQLEAGKARRHAFEEVADTAITARYYARVAAGLIAPRKVAGVFPLLSQVEVHHHPKGVVGIVSPWNYPLSLAITDAIPALLGAAVVVMGTRTGFGALVPALAGAAVCLLVRLLAPRFVAAVLPALPPAAEHGPSQLQRGATEAVLATACPPAPVISSWVGEVRPAYGCNGLRYQTEGGDRG